MMKFLPFFLMLCCSTSSLAKVYKCTNDDGKVFYDGNLKKLARRCENSAQVMKIVDTLNIKTKEGCLGKSSAVLKRSSNQTVAIESNPTHATVTLSQDLRGHYVAGGKINAENVTFLVDTGATYISVPATVAKCLQLKKGMAFKSMTANGVRTVYSTQLNSITLGGIEMTNVKAQINPSRQGDVILLGMSFLKKVEMNQKENQLVLRYKKPRINTLISK